MITVCAGAKQQCAVAGADTINRQTRNEWRKGLTQKSPDRFEALIGELLPAPGCEEETI